MKIDSYCPVCKIQRMLKPIAEAYCDNEGDIHIEYWEECNRCGSKVNKKSLELNPYNYD